MKKFEAPNLMVEKFNAEDILAASSVPSTKKSATALAGDDVAGLAEIFSIKLTK